jgi:hypothetical protein
MGNCLGKKPKTYRCGWCEKKITYCEIYSEYRMYEEPIFRFCSKECSKRAMMCIKSLNNK